MHGDEADFETRESVEFCTQNPLTKERFKLFGMLHLPKQQPPFPAVLMMHGLGGTKAGRHRLYVRLAEKLSKQGIATLRIDMRGCGDSEGSFKDVTLKSQVDDLLMGLDYLSQHHQICKERIGLLGRSMGGAVAVLVAEQMLKKKMPLSSIVLWCPLFSAKPWLKAFQEKGADVSKDLHFHGELISPLLLKELSALNLTTALETLKDIPFLFAHSMNDPLVPIEQTEEYMKIRKSAPNSQTRLCPFYGKDHEFSSPDEQVRLLEESAQWFQHSLCDQKKHSCATQRN